MDYSNIDPKKLLEIIKNDENNAAKKRMHEAYRYYENDNDVFKRKRQYAAEDGVLLEAPLLSNSKLAHPFFYKIVNQKIGYLLSKALSINSEDEAYTEALQAYLNKAFLRLLKRLGLEAILCGSAWLQVYYNSDGDLAFARIPTEELIPIWADGDHSKLLAMLRIYQDTNPLQDKKDSKTVEYHTQNGCVYYELKSGKLTELKRSGHVQIIAGQETIEADFGRIPFVQFRYNSREIPLIVYIKALIDEYDELTSAISDDIKDTPHSIKLVRGYAPNLGEFNRNLATFRAVQLDEGGSVDQLTNTLNTSACELQLSRLRKDIFDAASAVDSQDAAQGNTSGVAIRLRYADLDMDCASMGAEFAAALEELLHFIDADILAKGGGDFTAKDVDFVFNTDVSVNEMEVIQACIASKGVISDRTIVANHPWAGNVEEELAEMNNSLNFSEADRPEMQDDENNDAQP
ncbi:MAG: phage portal protein [Bacteroidales bacterium]|nr:phage portal protein [Bacteroidales bacterium]